MIDKNQVIENREDGSVSVSTINKEPTKTQQQFKDECDINNIMKKYITTGEFQHLTGKTGQYADFSGIRDYREMLETVQYAQEAFASLPAQTRARFQNDPGQLLSFIQDSKNEPEAIELGLIDKKIPPIIDNSPQPQPSTPPQK